MVRVEPSKTLIRQIGGYHFRRAKQIIAGKIDPRKDKAENIRLMLRFLKTDMDRILERKDKKPAHHPSGVKDCLRKLFFKHFGAPISTHDLRWEDVMKAEAIFGNGDNLHLRYQTLFQRMDILVRREFYLQDPTFGTRGLRGSIDALVRLNGRVQPVELKSMGSNGLRRLTKYGPSESYIGQCVSYLGMLRRQIKRFNKLGKKHPCGTTPPESAILFIESKDTQDVKEYTITADAKDYTQLKASALDLDTRIALRKIPDRPAGYAREGFPCGWCDFAKLCYSKRDSEAWLKTIRNGKA